MISLQMNQTVQIDIT